MSKNIIVVIMAGGLGKRMGSELPKVLHKIKGIPMLCHILLKIKNLKKHSNFLKFKKIFIVVGKFKDIIEEELKKMRDQLPNYEFIIQDEPLGTGHALQCCKSQLDMYPNTETLILSGDVPLIHTLTMNNLVLMDNKVKIITTITKDPQGYGRIIRNKNNNQFEKIVEHKDCSELELNINEINCGIYSINTKYLCKYLFHIENNNSQNEYYLTDIIGIIKREENVSVGTYEIPEEFQYEITGVNTLEQLRDLEIKIGI